MIGKLTRDIRRLGKTIRKTILKDLKINKLNQHMIYDSTSWCSLINVIDPT